MPVPEASFPATRQQLRAEQCSLSPLGGAYTWLWRGTCAGSQVLCHTPTWAVSATRGPAPVTQELRVTGSAFRVLIGLMHTETFHARLVVFQMLPRLAYFILTMIPSQRPCGCALLADGETEGLSKHQDLCTESHP